MRNKIKNKLEKLEAFLFNPHLCICCNGECDLDNNYRICSKCKDKLTFIDKSFCLKCGDKIGDTYDFCQYCQNNNFDFDYSRSVLCYDETSSPMIIKFKYNGQKMYKYPLSHLLFDYFKESDLVVNSVTYVPMPKKRQKERGYNQALELAQEFARLSGLPFYDFLERNEDKAIKQSTLNAKDRKENIKGTIGAINKRAIKSKDILLIDDVSTTGATTSECARVLKKCGARTVCVLTVAKTPREMAFVNKQ